MAEIDNKYRLIVSGVKKHYGATIALDGVDFSVAPGEVHALIGENGAGKSTLMKVLSGVVKPDAGTMYLDGVAYIPTNPKEARQLGIAMIYQELALTPHQTVAENIFLGLEPTSNGFLNRREMKERAKAALEELGHPEIDLNATVQSLSISAQQLVEIARSTAFGCKVLILDEPTSSLTQQDVQHLFKMINDLKSRGYSIIYISHFIEELKEIAQSFTVLRDGKTVGTGVMADASAEQIVGMMIGRDLKDIYPRSPHEATEPILQISSLKGDPKLKNADLVLRRGEVVGIAGLIGSGRTDLIRTIFGLDKVLSGEVKVANYTGRATPGQRWKQGVGFLSENRKEEGLAITMSIAENLILSDVGSVEKNGFISPRLVKEAARNWIERLSTKCREPMQKIGELSGGNQQKIAFARLLYHDVDVLLLDEPTRGIDVGSKSQIYKLIDDLATKQKAIIIISSYLPELMGVCDRIAVMSRGRLGVARPVSEVNEHSLMLEATATPTGEGE